MLQFEIETPEGNLETVTSNDVAQSFAQKGYQNVSISPDGLMISLTDANGAPGRIDVQKFVAGNAKVAGVLPTNVNYDTIDMGLRASIGALGNHDDLKKRYLEGQLREKGIEDAEVLGSGSNFFYFDPKTGSYNALTNKPGTDLSDIGGLTSYASPIAGFAGSALGGVAGATASAAPVLPVPGANIAAGIAGGAAGSAAGGWAARGLVDSAAKMLNPKLKPYLESEEIAQERNVDTAIDALGGGIGGALTKLPIINKLFQTGLASEAVKKGGQVAQGTGYLIKEPAKYLQSEALPAQMVRGVAENLVPVTGQAQLPALAMRSPEFIQTGIKKLGERSFSKADKLTEQLLKPESLQASAIEKNALRQAIRAAEKRGEKIAAARFVPESEETLATQFAKGVRGEAPRTAAVRPATPGENFVNLAKGTRAEEFMKGLQKPIDLSVKTGRAIDKINAGVVRGTLRGAELAGQGLYSTGKAARELGTAISPLENRLWLQGGLQSEDVRRSVRGK